MAMKQHNGAYIAAYRDGFFDGMSADQKYPQTLSVLGYSLDQIIDIIQNRFEGSQWTAEEAEVLKKRQKEYNDMRVANFTRKEAIQKCHGINHPECLVQALEAMGLIEFKPEPKKVTIIDIVDVGPVIIKRDGKWVYED